MLDVRNKKQMIILMIKNKGKCILSGDNMCAKCSLYTSRLCNHNPRVALDRCKAAAVIMKIAEEEIFDQLL